MLHPVLPPTPPPLVEPIQPANSTLSASDTQFHLVGEIDNSAQNKQETSPSSIVEPKNNSGRSPTVGRNPSVILDGTPSLPKSQVATPASTPSTSTPETFPPEFSSPTTPTSAVNLGQPLAIGYPLQGTTNSDSSIVPNTTNTQKFPSYQERVSSRNFLKQAKKDQITVQQTAGNINISASADNAPTNQPTQNVIEFKSRNSINKLSVSSTSPQPQSSATTPNNTPPAQPRIVEVTSDRQEYDEQRRIITAEGNVIVRFDGAVLDADRVQVNLDNLIAAGSGNVTLARGDQILRGQSFTYNFIQDSGELTNGRGEIYVPSAQTDFAFLPTDITAGGVPRELPSDRIRANQPLTGVSSPGGIDFVFGGRQASNLPTQKSGGQVNRIRFEAKQIEFYPRGWQARNVRLTNDPFSPPELEIRADKVTVTRQAPLIDRVNTQRQRLVFDDKFSLPIPVSEQTIDRRERETTPLIFSPGFDGDKRGGLFIERGVTLIDTDNARLQITPQFFVQKAIQEQNDLAGLFGAKAKLNAILSPRAVLQGSGELTSFNLDKLDENLKASLRLRQTFSDQNPYVVNWEYSYRDRLYNGTLGFQTVQSSLGGVISSPTIPLGKSGINLSYQAGAQYIEANTDRPDLLKPIRDNDRISLGRFQSSAALSTGISLWRGKPLAPTATEGLKYTPTPVVPYLQAIAGVTGTTSYYTNGDNQSTLIGTIGLVGQIGHFSRPFLDYTAFNLIYSQGLTSGLSPFLFDRSVDNQVLSAGISQQIYGPVRLGFQTSINLDTGEQSSTDYTVEYSRRTYGITLRYNPVLELGGISIRISDFNWTGGTDPFSNGDVKPVVGGVVRQGN